MITTVRTAPTANCFWHSGMNRPVLNWPVMNRPVMKRPGIPSTLSKCMKTTVY